jgi:hypothetical protein
MSRKLQKHILTNFTEEQMTTQFANAVNEKEVFDVEDWLSGLDIESHE